ncbi:MAG: hypothetical protein JWQ78_2254 [Sediminibacterium sp.]|nr:hypothetical protein [Sediminibacterium sp.]
MKKYLYILVFVFSSLVPGFSQERGSGSIQNLKIGFTTRQLSLTSDEAQRFWPVYNEYVAEMRKVKTEEKDDVLVFEEKALGIRKKYKVEFKKILLTDDRANKALTVDRDFNNVLKKELQRRRDMRMKRKDTPQKDLQ